MCGIILDRGDGKKMDWTVNNLKQKLETSIPQPEYFGEWNPDIEEQLKLYKDFQTEFPIAKIRNLTLKEYNNTERKNAFCYWIETRLRKLGSIQGSTSYKFGIYEYNDDPRDDNGYSFDGQYAWLSKYGKSSDEAYEKVHSNIINIIEAAQHGDLDEIEKIDISPMFKWKIAFLYSDFTLMNIFSREGLVYLANKYGLEFADKASLCKLYQFLLSKKGTEEHLLKYSARIWNEWLNSDECKSKKNNTQGDTQMTDYEKKLDEIKNNLSVNRNVILTGAPGTGKTFMAKTVAARIILEREINDFDKDLTEEEKKQVESQTDFVQFHPSYDYTDFVEGLRPKQVDGSDQIGFERKDGVFKAFCEKALKNLVDSRKSKEELAIEKNIIKAINDFLSISTGKDNLYYSAYVQKDFYIDDIENEKFKVYYSDGKLIGDIELKDLEIILQNIEKIKKETRIIETVGEILNRQKYHKMNSYIWVLCEKIDELILDKNENFESIPLKNFVFIIDEINRGEVAKIFGELFYCIDPGYRGEKGRISTQYQNLVTSGEFQKGFFIPENVYIIGTMNDIDRSVESMDFAFRRRFSWIEVKASDTVNILDPKHDDNGELIAGLENDLADEARRRMENLNAAISKIDELNEAYHIGASYFLKLNNYDGDFGKLWDYHIKGILTEYLRGNPNAQEELDKLEAAYDKAEETKAGE